jgi:hypothetical protein
MALVDCKECSKQISDRAEACPRCGAPVTRAKIKATGKTTKSEIWMFLGLMLFIGWLIFQFSSATDNKSAEDHKSPVFNSAWDGSVYQAERYLKDRLKDPDSYESIGWGEVGKLKNGNYTTWVKYRAKNGFGGYTVSKALFILSPEGEVLIMNQAQE